MDCGTTVMESDSLLIYIENLENVDIQTTARAFDCIQRDASNDIYMEVHAKGSVKLRKLPDGTRCIAMYGVLPQKVKGYEEYESEDNALFNFETCLSKILRIKNLKSILFPRNILINDKYIEALESFSESTEALVYIRGEKVQIIHRSFGNLLQQIELWRENKSGWDRFFQARIADKTISNLNAFLQKEAEEYFIYPPPDEIFNAMKLTSLQNIKVIIIGQDPYHTPGAAMGLAFSHKSDYGKLQPSLRNIYKELENCGYKVDKKSGDLTKWAKQGVFLINTALTVRQGQANSHSKEWIPFTEHLFKYLNSKLKHCVIIMWGSFAQKYTKYFGANHAKLMSSHPCPMSVNGFLGCKHFIKCNDHLKEWGMKEIDWNLC